MTIRRSQIAVVVCALLALALNWTPGLDDAAERYLAEAMTDNLLIYATARSLNGIISVIQSIELSVRLGAGVGIHLGEILDPLNDLIERFSSFVLYGLAGLGLQKLVLVATSSFMMKVLVTCVLLAGTMAWLWRPLTFSSLPRFVLLLLLVRFAFVIEVGTVAALDRAYFDARTSEAHSALMLARDALSNLRANYLDSIAERGFVTGSWDAAANILGGNEQEGITEIAASAIVELIVITFVRGLLLPLAFVWLLLVTARWLVQTGPAKRVHHGAPSGSSDLTAG